MKRALMVLVAMAAMAVYAEEKAAYPLTTCVVSGDTLGEMGDPVIYNHEGREVRFCCKDCVKDFKKDPAKYLKKLDAAEAKTKKE